MYQRCPVCEQPLPAGINQKRLRARLNDLRSKAIAIEERRIRSEIQQDFDAKLKDLEHDMRKEAERVARSKFQRQLNEAEKARKSAEHLTKSQIAAAVKLARAEDQNKLNRLQKELLNVQRSASDQERKYQDEIKRAQANADRAAKQAESRANKAAAKRSKEALERSESSRQKERKRFNDEILLLRKTVDQLSRKLEKQSSEQSGEVAEIDLFTLLRLEFPKDRIERVGKGTRGADVVQGVVEDGKEIGRIVYESKNVNKWQKSFISQAKRSQVRHETPYVVIVSRAFPRNKRGFCIVNGIPVIEPSLVTALGAILRDAIAELAGLRPSTGTRDDRSTQMFAFVLSDEFSTRFNDIADAARELQSLQKSEQDWHESQWKKERDLHEQLSARHREIGTKLRSISREQLPARRLRLARSAT